VRSDRSYSMLCLYIKITINNDLTDSRFSNMFSTTNLYTFSYPYLSISK
jgi:hypothetical protein